MSTDPLAGPRVVLMCGIAGAGKTTYAQTLEADGFVRLSIDEEIWRKFGRYGIDYPADQYRQHSNAAERTLELRLTELVREGRNVVVDLSFWQRAERDRYRTLVTAAGGRCELVYLKVDADTLRARLNSRSRRFDANATFSITDEILSDYLKGFEEPSGEGETVITPD